MVRLSFLAAASFVMAPSYGEGQTVRAQTGRLFGVGVTLPDVPKNPQSRLHLSAIAIVMVLALISAACDSSGSTETSTSLLPDLTSSTEATTTTEAPLTSIPSNSIPGETSPSISPEVAAAMRADIGVLMLDVEESRGLPFLEIPTVTILDEADFSARVRTTMEEELDPVELDGDQAVFELLGMLDGSTDLFDLLVELYTEQVAGFYDPDEGELVVPVSTDGISSLQEITIAHELVHALTDQHFDFNDVFQDQVDNGTGDDASGTLGLVEGDATYQQFLYLEAMDPSNAVQAVLESLSIDTSVFDAAPQWIQQDLTFPYEHGLVFTGFLVDEGGLKGVDEAYLDLPVSSEQILHPEKYLRSEQPTDLAPLTVELAGWSLFDEATFGEWGIRLLLLDSLIPGELTQAAAGWGNDTYRAFVNGDDTAISWVYEGETIEDAEDLANGLIAHIRNSMNAGSAVESGGGLLYDEGSTYVFIDRVDEKVFLVASTDAAAGASLREQLNL
jgi:hypothetical protein